MPGIEIRRVAAGALVAAALSLAEASPARGQDVDGGASFVQPAGILLMPFDNTTNHASFQIVTRAGPRAPSGPVATHWSYWADDCRHLVDVLVCLTPSDTAVMDSTKVQGEVQFPNPPRNHRIGSITDLTGERGLVTVSAFAARTGPSGLDCTVADPGAILDHVLVGGWAIANTATNAAFGADAIGLSPGALPDPDLVVDAGLVLQTFNPMSLEHSAVILLGVELGQGNGRFREVEIGPIRRRRVPDSQHVCCSVQFTDNLEVTTSLPDLCWRCAGFHPISATQAAEGNVSIIPPATTIDAPGFVRLRSCRVGDIETGAPVPLGEPADQFVFAIHGQAIGVFGAAWHGKYTGATF